MAWEHKAYSWGWWSLREACGTCKHELCVPEVRVSKYLRLRLVLCLRSWLLPLG